MDNPHQALSDVSEAARRDMARTQTDFLGRMAQCLHEYQDIFDEHPDGDLGGEARKDADDAILSLAGLALAQLLMLRGFNSHDVACLAIPTDLEPIDTSVGGVEP